MNIEEAIKTRHSVRVYTDKIIENEKCEILNAEIEKCNKDGNLDIKLVTNEPKAFSGKIAHYGRFGNVKNYIIISGKKENNLDLRAGYYGERLVLLAQSLGLNTCWVGMTYSKVDGLFNDNTVCVIAIGYGESQGVAHRTKKVDDVSNYNGKQPEWFKQAVEAALLAPSALNQQKYYFEYTDKINDGKAVISAQKKFTLAYGWLDLGIAKYHFETIAKDKFVWAED